MNTTLNDNVTCKTPSSARSSSDIWTRNFRNPGIEDRRGESKISGLFVWGVSMVQRAMMDANETITTDWMAFITPADDSVIRLPCESLSFYAF
ncbi:hypothetical protein T265_10846 [Opisthorchis viverrini]|uniref:Uncharacterized protein n=1 Tax=Opisthorchis viverrini TaxID=6198 RepID=A0A074ZZU6_OPIVI|nr:hypothetical protein T265_10846 [Opisthorchis viverrini]KER20654.1 hypothetical protein T265_10846 [Opisthorchis viverrini]